MKIKDIRERYYEYPSYRDGKRVIMRNLHDAFGIDWCKPYKEIYHEGKFTIRLVEKELENYGYKASDALILVLVKNEADCDRWDVVTAGNGDFDVHVPNCLDKFYTKGDFNNIRKKTDIEAIFFAQERKYLKGSRYYHASYGDTYYRNPQNVDVYKRFRDKDTAPYYYHDFDKSGYCLDVYAEDFNNRVKKYKHDKHRAEYLKTDNTDKITTLERLIQEYKTKLSQAILSATTSEEVQEIGRYVDSWGTGLYGILFDYESFKKKTLEKSFDSVKESNRCYDSCAKRLYSYLNV